MTPWRWWAGCYSDVEYEDRYTIQCATRDQVIAEALRVWAGCDEGFYIIEARSSSSKREFERAEDFDFIPFLQTRNAEFFSTDDIARLDREASA